jgi:hypothetical protein
MSSTDLLIRLKTELVNFIDELIETFPSETDFIIFRVFVQNQVPIEDVMNYIVAKLCPLKDMVKGRNEAFFLENNILFENFDETKQGKINYFKRLWSSGLLTNEDKETIWRWFDSFIYLGFKYKKSLE